MRLLGRIAVTALVVLAASALAFAGEKGIAQGKVTAVADHAVTITDDTGAAWTFAVAKDTRVYAPGAGHRSRMLISSGKKTTLDDFVREGHRVSVHFREQDGSRYITQLRVL